MKLFKNPAILIVFVMVMNTTCNNQFVIDILDRNDSGKYGITMESLGSGKAIANPNPPARGGMVTIWAEPEPGFTFVGWQVLSGDVSLSSTTQSPATFDMPSKSVKIRAVFIEVAIPPIEIKNNEKTYTGSGLQADVDYISPVTSGDAGTLLVKYVGVAGDEYSSPVNAGIYGIYISTNGGYGYPAVTVPVNIGTFIITKAPGGPIDSPLSLYTGSPAYNSIRVNAVTASTTGQAVEYAISKTNSPPSNGWQPEPRFNGLTAETDYYIFARSVENNNYLTGDASPSLLVPTPLPPDITIVGGNFVLPEGGGIKGQKQLVVLDDNGDDITSSISWTNSNPGVATVSSSGLVTSVIQGSTRITAEDGNGAMYTITVSVQRNCWLTGIDGNGTEETALWDINIIDAAAGKFTLKSNGEVRTDRQFFSFLYLETPVSGDFTMTVKLDSISFGTGTGTTPVAGICAIRAAGFTPNSTGKLTGSPSVNGSNLLYASATLSMSLGNSTRRWWQRIRSSSGNDYSQVQIGTGTAPDTALNNGRWIRLSRTGNKFISAYSDDGGANWVTEESETVTSLGASVDVYVGLWVAAGQGAANNTVAGFSEWSFVNGNGNATQAELSSTSARINFSNEPLFSP